ncbi:hypothetical protein Deipe_0414 [Deinococcus peraridilitoris DSM 19664]|uniref:Uncharacterized protein n=1 Tax=Deinococcus peraridilitoris (strain DSM 19664 / LMG 22246 / CIP 109416 / KR-200) TaxID=937777 RepID=K9ZWI8_DEIPD|nr:hypothetical protein Deipe_0414 [Deinococcus peraridilitoris DSM 19664]
MSCCRSPCESAGLFFCFTGAAAFRSPNPPEEDAIHTVALRVAGAQQGKVGSPELALSVTLCSAAIKVVSCGWLVSSFACLMRVPSVAIFQHTTA